MEFSGVTRIRNPKTLQKWIDNGRYNSAIEFGLVFNVGCGRFRESKCECGKCRKSVNSPLKKVLEENNLKQF